jgi:catechol 2,3-dioxygenase-like lactoylglutathione lyase family enzyme
MPLLYFGIRVRNLERSIRFYRDVLGLKLVLEGEMGHGGKYAHLVDPRTHQRLELNWYPPGSPFATKYVAGEGLDHLGFKASDARRTYRRWVSLGAHPAMRPWIDPTGQILAYVKDLDGNWIEVFQVLKKPRKKKAA